MSISGAAVEAEAEESCRSKSWRRSRWQSDDDDPGGDAVSPWPLGPPGASGGTAASSLRGSARGPEESSLLTSIFQSGGEREREREREREEGKSKSMPDHTIGRSKSGESLGVVLSSSFSLSNRAKHRKSESLFFLSEAPVYQTERGYALFTALCFASAAASGAGE
jgi:hypothetical protein